MNHETESMARITATRAVYDAGEYYRPTHSLNPRQSARVMLLCFSLSLLAFYWLAGVM